VVYDGTAIGTGSHNMERHLSTAVFIFGSTNFAALENGSLSVAFC